MWPAISAGSHESAREAGLPCAQSRASASAALLTASATAPHTLHAHCL